MDLETIAAGLSGLGQVRLEAEACIRGKSPWVKCSNCQEVCPVNGIDLGTGRPGLTDCQRCGLCAVACPAGALEDPERTHSFFLARGREAIAAAGQAVFACNRSREEKRKDNWILAACLGAVAPEVMIALAVRGKVVFLYQQEECAACPWGKKGAGVFRASFERAQKALAAMNLPADRLVQRATVAPATSGSPAGGKATVPAAMGRREFFRSLIRGIRIPGVDPPPARATPLVSQRRSLILRQALQEARPEGGYPAGATLHLASLELAGPCYLCNICSRLCPTGALELDGGELKYTPARCNHCDLCLAVCPQHSLVRGADLTLEAIVKASTITLATAVEHHCAGCGETFQASTTATECLRCLFNHNLAGSVSGGGGA
ncbi:4Fe-4S binding protein [Moorella sp. Hama-1]|uniref:4Fe-4S binding protein n=1 Tax=Moorella sp. Hama-1 TaxID=2138101 RepID=UPI000D65B716|nr:4Fe-4S binding protein [Moorella sp. Hama-1]BCV21545.1 4Fe-4S ferredoxin [Moorella sp. Hama-1]